MVGIPGCVFRDGGWYALKRPWMWGWAAFSLLYFLLGFSPGVVRSDDFGYLRGVLGTLERGRPYVYEWLEPFGAVFSSACALLYLATGNFLLSTWGFQAGCVLAFYPLLYRLTAARLARRHAALVTLVLATFPVFFAKEADFHAGICTLDLFLLSLILFEKGNETGKGKTVSGWFFLAAFLAFANRQNHVALLLLPAWIALGNSRSGSPMSFKSVPWASVAWVLAFMVAAAGLYFSMNRTYASVNAGFLHAKPLRLLGDSALALAAGGYLALGWLGAFSALAGRAPGLGSAPFSLLSSSRSPARSPWRGKGLRRWAMPGAATLGLLALMPFWHDTLLHTDTTLFGLAGWPQVNRLVPWLVLPFLWLLDYRLLRPSPYLMLIAGYLGIAALRGTLWDYYFMEISILCLLIVLGARTEPHPGDEGVSGVTSIGMVGGQEVARPRLGLPALAALAVVLAGNAAYAYLLKVQSDKQAVTVRAFERLEREGRITVDAMTGSTFGYLGWKLFDRFIATDGREFGELAGFMGYVRRDRVTLETGLPWRSGFKGPLPPGAVQLDSGYCRVGFARVRYRIADLRGPDSNQAVMGRPLALASPLDTVRFRPPRFPLNGREWRALADSARGRAFSPYRL